MLPSRLDSVRTIRLTLIGKPGCHLCDDARAVVDQVVGEVTGTDDAPHIERSELSILDDPALHDRYVEEIPVLLIDGTVHTIWLCGTWHLRTALKERE